mmetsp:Transcript_11848/g.20031  ORF Transcript_11848/g.20031 Transcript_11848/m.20031 type:complete len:230 (+) Transcript_11848:98-787(+)
MHLNIIGEVPMMFFVPECSESARMKQLIEAHGGLLVEQHECLTFQIKPDHCKLKQRDFYEGSLYGEGWIQEYVEAHCKLADKMQAGGSKMMVQKDEHFIQNIGPEKSKKLNISKKKKLTIVEGLKLFEIINSNHKYNLKKHKFWESIAEQKFLPERSPDQLKNFWRQYENYTAEQWLVTAIHMRLEYSFSLKSIPNRNFLATFKQRYRNEFQRIQSQNEDAPMLPDFEE